MDEPKSSGGAGPHFQAKDAATLAAEAKEPPPTGRRRHRRRFSQKLRTRQAIQRARVIFSIVALSAIIIALSFYLGNKSTEIQMGSPYPSGRR